MKFEEKLIKLRRENAFSQEDLAEKLDVTRQTVSKWELGQSKPDMEKLIEISKLFNVGLEKLTDDSIDLNDEKTGAKEGDKKNLKIVIIVIAIIIGIILVARIIFTLIAFNNMKRMLGNAPGNMLDMFFGKITEMASDNFETDNDSEEVIKNELEKALKTVKEITEETEQEASKSTEMLEEVKEKYEEQTKKMYEQYEEKRNDALQKQDDWYQEQKEKQKQMQEEWKKENWPSWAQ